MSLNQLNETDPHNNEGGQNLMDKFLNSTA